MKDIILVTADSVRYDYLDEIMSISSLQTLEAKTPSHYTRPSLAGLLSSKYQSIINTKVVEPSLASVLSENGYTCIGLSPSPQTDQKFGFSMGFDQYPQYSKPGSRGSWYRQFLTQFNIVRKAYYHIYPPTSDRSDIPTDKELIEDGIRRFNELEPPRFLWIHLLDTHRPYGRGKQAASKETLRKALTSPSRMSEKDDEKIIKHYKQALNRLDDRINKLLNNLESESRIFVFAGDHGDEFGEHGYYFHQPHRCRVVDEITSVPLAVDGIELQGEGASLIDLPPTLVSGVNAEPPDEWQGTDLTSGKTESTITIAPWNQSSTVLWQDFSTRLVCEDANISLETKGERYNINDEVPEGIQSQLNDLGYIS